MPLNLKAIIAQQLIPRQDGSGRAAVVEVLLNSPLMQDRIRRGEVHLMKELMAKSGDLGMQTFDQALFKAHKAGDISQTNALLYADAPNDLRLMMKLDAEGADVLAESPELTFDDAGLRGRNKLP